jgi:aryl-alcohol dehydrogenase-like predicted oxidoreductase
MCRREGYWEGLLPACSAEYRLGYGQPERGPYANEELVGETLAPYKGEIVVATKFGWDIDPVERKPSGGSRAVPMSSRTLPTARCVGSA